MAVIDMEKYKEAVSDFKEEKEFEKKERYTLIKDIMGLVFSSDNDELSWIWENWTEYRAEVDTDMREYNAGYGIMRDYVR